MRSFVEFPRLEAYLEQLPEGLDSFPECRAKASIHRKVYEHSGLPLVGLPPRLQDLIDNRKRSHPLGCRIPAPKPDLVEQGTWSWSWSWSWS
jgi:hypothetical protein